MSHDNKRLLPWSGRIADDRQQNMTQPIITLTTDFGLTDHFVGVMKGVILSIAPKARIVDIT
ncbi:MAG: SAM-dependent chlorinase/fluorinase, partial [Bryobacterales bacterium]|nr:SAM-dependent chlorinase/fluorinase [Bryobacterales bacterium]